MNLTELFHDKKKLIACFGAVIGCLILLFCSFSDGKTEVNDTKTEPNPAVEIERRLESTLSSIKGAGKVKVFIMLEDFGTNSYASDTKSADKKNESGREVSNESSTVLSGGSAGVPVVSKKQTPNIKGVIITATGASNETVKKNLREAAIAALAVLPHRIEVVEGK